MRDPFAASSHWAMAALMIVATVLLRRYYTRHHLRHSITIFSTGVVLLYIASGLYHTIPRDNPHLLYYQKADMGAIYLMIAGCATPVLVAVGAARALGITWLITALGIAQLWIFALPSYGIIVSIYVLLALIPMTQIRTMHRVLGKSAITILLAECLVYLAGAAIDLLKAPTLINGILGPHELLHCSDIIGTLLHLYLIARFLKIPPPRA